MLEWKRTQNDDDDDDGKIEFKIIEQIYGHTFYKIIYSDFYSAYNHMHNSIGIQKPNNPTQSHQNPTYSSRNLLSGGFSLLMMGKR